MRYLWVPAVISTKMILPRVVGAYRAYSSAKLVLI